MIWKDLFSGLVRWVLMALFGALVDRGIIQQGQVKPLVESGVYYALLFGIPVLVFLFKLAQAKFNQYRLEAAKEMPANTTNKELSARVLEKIREAVGK